MTVIRGSVIWCVGLVLALTTPSLAQELVAPLEGPSSDDGLITIESDSQTADNVSGVVTAIGNVRIVYPSRGMVATSRQAQYFSREQRIVLSGDVDVVQTDGHTLRADQVTVLLDEQRTLATTSAGQQVTSSWSLQDPGAVLAP